MGRQENSEHISVWIEKELLKECETNQKLMGIRSRNAYIEEALKFYNGYIHEKGNEKYINETVMKPMDEMMRRTENRISRLMFKQAVEMCKIFWMVAKGFHIDPDDVDEFHADCVAEVKRINGVIQFPRRQKDDED